MFNRTIVLGLAVAAFAACAGEPAEDAPSAAELAAAADEQALQDFRAYWEEHYNMGHASMVAATYHEEAWTLPSAGGIVMGPAAIEADLEKTMASSPTASIAGLDNMLFGDQAVTMGTYAVQSTGPDGEPMEFDGTYMNLMARVDGAWLIEGSIVNYGEARPDWWTWNEPDSEPMPDEGTMGEFTDYFATHWNMGHASMVAETYTEDAMVSYSNGPVITGRAAVETEIGVRIGEGTQLTIHNVGTIELGEGWTLDGGWYLVDGPDDAGTIQTGTYLHLLQQQEDGSWMIHWAVTTAQPPSGM